MRKFNAGQVTQQRAVRVQDALRISGRSRRVDDDGGILRRRVDRRMSRCRLFEQRRPAVDRSGHRVRDADQKRRGDQLVADRQHFIDSFGVRNNRFRAAVVQPVLDGVRSKQCEQRKCDRADAICGEMRDQGLRALRKQDSDPIAACDAVGIQGVGEPARLFLQVFERHLNRRAFGALADQGRAGFTGMTIADRRGDVEPLGDGPCEIGTDILVRPSRKPHKSSLVSLPNVW